MPFTHSTLLRSTALRFGYELQYNSNRQAVDGSDLGGYGLSNLHLIADKWARGLEVSLDIYNSFDKRHQHPIPTGNRTNALAHDGRGVNVKLVYQF